MKLYRKIMFLAIIGLFFGAGVLPSISGNTEKEESKIYLDNASTEFFNEIEPKVSTVKDGDEHEDNVALSSKLQYQIIEDEIYFYHSVNNRLVNPNKNSWAAAIRITPEELNEYDGWMLKLSKVSFYQFSSVGYNGYLKIYGEGTSMKPDMVNLLAKKSFSASGYGWVTINLDMPILIDIDQDIWVSIWIYDCGVCIAGDNGPAVYTKGDWLFEDMSWKEYNWFGYDFNWNIKVVVEGVPPQPDLECSTNSLSWLDVKPNTIQTGTISIQNAGDAKSELDWEIVESDLPSWGTWTFTPLQGENLKPGDGTVTIQVAVVAPDVQETSFSGNIRIINKEDSSDSCIISASLTTPKNKPYINTPFLNFLEKHPHMFPLLRQLLKLY